MNIENKKKLNRLSFGFLASPGGIVLFFLAIIFELLDLLIPGGALTFEIFFDLIYAIFFLGITGSSFKNVILPFLIERIPFLSDILPSWVLKLFGIF